MNYYRVRFWRAGTETEITVNLASHTVLTSEHAKNRAKDYLMFPDEWVAYGVETEKRD